jgi:hypothetical protein
MPIRKPRGDDWLKTPEQLQREIAIEEGTYTPPKEGSVGIGIALCLGAVAFSGWGLYELGATYAEYRRIQGWVPASAIITELSRTDTGRYGSTDMEYRYEHQGARCIGHRVNIRRDAGSSFFVRFEEAFRRQRPIQVWIDPNARCSAIADRDFPAVMLFSALLALGGSGALIFHIRRNDWKFAA